MTRTDTDAGPPPGSKRQRIAKLMARAGLCSRRDAEAWIVDGRVSLNGDVLTSPAVDVAPDDQILVDGAPLPALEKTRLFLFHKPRGLVTSDHDPEGRTTVADYLREHWPEGPRVVTIGRLDINTEGLLLLTNDGGLARMLELPQTGWVRRYRVRAKGIADPAALDALANGVSIDGIDYAGIEAKLDRVQGANVWLTMGLREGKNREIKRVLEHLGLEVNRLIRLSFGPFQLLDVPEGAVEEVRTRVLRDQLGPKLAAQAGVDFGDAPQVKTAPPEPSRQPFSRPQPTDRKAVERSRPDRSPSRPDQKPARAERGTRAESARPGDRHGRRREPMAEPPPKRERPMRGTRKHVSAMRAERAETARGAPRTRIERSDTRDRRDRSVTVERLVRPQAEGPVARRPRSFRDRPKIDDGAQPSRRPRSGAGERDGRGRRASGDAKRSVGQRRHASPSAEGKRERIARSGLRRDGAASDQTTGRGRSGTKRSFGDVAKQPLREGRPNRRRDGRQGQEAQSPSGSPRPPRREASADRPSRGEDRRRGAPRDAQKSRSKPTRGKPPSGGRRGPQKPKR